MIKSLKFWQTNRPFAILALYVFGAFLVYVGNKIYPTNLAGPGLDLLIFLLLIICWFINLVYAIARIIKKDKTFVLPAIIHLFAFLAMLMVFYIAW